MTNARNQDTPIHPVIGKLFALVTCKLEDLHEPSVNMHRPVDIPETSATAAQIQSAAAEISVLCEVIQLLVTDSTN